MKKIFLMILSIMFIVLSCKAATTPIDQKRDGIYVSDKQFNGSSYLVFKYSSGGFELYYSKDKTTGAEEGTNTKKNKAAAENISGQDPNYTFQTGEMAGTLQFLSNKIVKVTVTFNSESSSSSNRKDILCYRKPD